MADDRVDIDIHADDNASAPLRTVIKSLDDLGDTAVKQSTKIRSLEKSLAELKDEARDMAARMKLAERSIQKMGNEALKSAAKIQALELAMSNLGRAGGGFGGRGGKVPGGFFGGIVNGGRKLRGFIMFMLIPVLGDAVGALATLGGAATAAGAAAIGALGPLLGLVAALPGALAAVGSGAAATMIGLKGMSEAISTLWDKDATTEELDAAMKGLTRNGRILAFTIAEMKKPATKLQRELQMALTPGLNNLAQTVKEAIPWFQELFGRSAYRVGQLAKDFSSLLQQTKTQEQIARIMLNSKELITSFGTAGLSAFRGLLNIMVAAGPMVQRLADDLARFVERIADLTDRSGPQMEAFFEKTYNVTKELIKFIADLSMGLYNVFKIGADLGGEMGDSFLDMGEKFRDFTESVSGQKSIQNWFDTMKPVIYEVGLLVRDIGKGLGELSMDGTLVGTLQVVRTELLPALMEFLRATSGKFIPLIAQILAAIAKVFTEIEFFPVTLKIIADFFSTIAGLVELLPDPLKKALGYIIAIAAVLKLATFVGIFRGMGTAAGGAAGKVGILSRAVGFLGAVGPQILITAIAAIGVAAFTSAQKIDQMSESTNELIDALLKTSSLDAAGNLADQIDEIREAYNSALYGFKDSEGFMGGLFNTDTLLNSDFWGDVSRGAGHFLKATAAKWNPFDDDKSWEEVWGQGPEFAQDRYKKMLDEAQAAQQQYYKDTNRIANELFPENRIGDVDFSFAETSDQLSVVQEIADTLGVDLTQGYDKARDAIVGYYNAVYTATPASAEFYQSLMTLQDGASTAAERVGAFESALRSLRDMMTGGSLADAQVEAAKGFSDFSDAFKDSNVQLKDGVLVYKAAAKANWNLHGALKAQAGAIENVAIATMQQTGDVAQATAAYQTEYDKLLKQTAKGLEANGMNAKQAATAAEQLVAQYALTPDAINTIFTVNPQGIQTLLEAGVQMQDIVAYLEQGVDANISPASMLKIQQTLGQPVTVPVKPQITVPGGGIPQSVLQGMPDISTPTTVTAPTVSTTNMTPAVNTINDINTGLNTIGTTTATPSVPTSGMSMAASMIGKLKQDLLTMPTSKTITVTYIPGRAMGGPVEARSTYMVGEIGPEMFVSNTGSTKMIGMNGPEIRSFPSSGYVIPNHALVKEGMTAEEMQQLSSAVAGRTAKPSLSGEYQAATQQAVVNIGTINAQSDIDIVRAVKKGIAEAERNRKERS